MMEIEGQVWDDDGDGRERLSRSGGVIIYVKERQAVQM